MRKLGESQFRHASYFLDVLRRAGDYYMQGGEAIEQGLILFDENESNIEVAQSWAEKNLRADHRAAELCKDFPGLAVELLDLRQHPRDSIRWLEAGVVAAQLLNDRSAEANHLNNLASAYVRTGRPDLGITYSTQALAIFREIGDRQGEHLALTNLGQSYRLLGDISRSLEFTIQALMIAQETGDHRGKGVALNSLGQTYYVAGDFHRAIKLHEHSLELARRTNNRRGENISLNNLGQAFGEIGETARAIGCYEQALVIAREMRDQRGESMALNNLAQIYHKLGEMERAHEAYEATLLLVREISDRRAEAELFKSIGDLYIDMGNIQQAIKFHHQHFQITREINHRPAGEPEYASASESQGKTSSAKKKQKRPPADKTPRVITWLHLSDIHFREGAGYNENIVLEPMLEDIADRIREEKLQPDFIMFTGDLAFSGKAAEYAIASNFFDKLIATTKLSKARLFVVPGNHDIDRRLVGAESYFNEAIKDTVIVNNVLADPKQRKILMSRFKGYREFVNDYFDGHLTFDDDHYFYVRALDLVERRVAILGLNSAWLAESNEDAIRKLVIGERQARDALKIADEAKADLKIALMHHPAGWIREFDQSASIDLLNVKCDFILHGHLHKAATVELRNPDASLMVIAGGACYETRQYPNSYNFVRIDLTTRKGKIYFRGYSDVAPGFWTDDTKLYKNTKHGVYEFNLPSRPLR